MDCRDLEKCLPSFFEDLLDENGYQEVHKHLEACERCKEYADNTGSLSYQLSKLGETVSVPEDLTVSILSRLKQEEEIPETPKSKNPVWPWIIFLILGLVGVFFGIGRLKTPIVLEQEEEISEEEARKLLEKLNVIAEHLEKNE